MVVVLDASGSMKETDAGGGASRMKAAQDAVATLTSSLGVATPVSLVAYGSKTPGDNVPKKVGCADVTVEQALAAGAGAKVAERARALKPGGWTPIAASLARAAQQLGGKPGTVVLVSDGADTCAPPQPCQEAKQLRKANPGLTISTVGFKSDQDQLKCVADAAGGVYVTADNAAQLATRLSASVDADTARTRLAPQGALGISVGDTHGKITEKYPDFPAISRGTTREFDGKTLVFIVWRNCEWGFDGSSLVVINPLTGRTIDDLGVGSARSEVEAVLGEPVSGGSAGRSLYVADKAKGLAWEITYDSAGTVTVIALCHCLPKEQKVITLPGTEMSTASEIEALNLSPDLTSYLTSQLRTGCDGGAARISVTKYRDNDFATGTIHCTGPSSPEGGYLSVLWYKKNDVWASFTATADVGVTCTALGEDAIPLPPAGFCRSDDEPR